MAVELRVVGVTSETAHAADGYADGVRRVRGPACERLADEVTDGERPPLVPARQPERRLEDVVAASDLIPMLKKCDRNLTIILVSDEKSLPMVRKIRREGIFYHALRPVSAEDREEIRLAVECAFKNVLNVLTIQ